MVLNNRKMRDIDGRAFDLIQDCMYSQGIIIHQTSKVFDQCRMFDLHDADGKPEEFLLPKLNEFKRRMELAIVARTTFHYVYFLKNTLMRVIADCEYGTYIFNFNCDSHQVRIVFIDNI